MDWAIEELGPLSIEIEFIGRRGRFTTMSWPGYIGVLQGVAKGRFSATINFAPEDGVGPQWPPSFLLREAFETCDSFDEAVELLVDTESAASVFFVCLR